MEKVQKGQMQTLTSLRDFVLCAKKVLTFAKLKLCERQQLQNGSIANITYNTCSIAYYQIKQPFILPNLERPAYVICIICEGLINTPIC